MSWQVTTHGIVLLLAGLFAFWSAFFALRLRRNEESSALFLLGFGIGMWCVGYGVATGLSDLSSRIFWAKVQYLGMPLVPTSMFVLVLHYVGLDRWVRGAWRVVWAALPLLCVVLAWTNDYHGWVWVRSSLSMKQMFGTHVLQLQHSWFFWFFVVYSYALLFGAGVHLFCRALKGPRQQRKQSFVLLAGILLPWVANSVFLFMPKGLFFDPTPLGCALGLSLMVWGLFRYRLFSLVPIARSQIIETLPDGIIVLDMSGVVVDINASGTGWLSMFGVDACMGRHVSHCIAEASPMIEELQSEKATEIDVLRERDGKTYHMHIRLSAITGEKELRIGYVLVINDATIRKSKEEELRLLATTDGLTGLLNRRTFFEMGEQSFALAERYDKPLSALMLDIDHFKSVNDTYGHHVGDLVLSQVATCLSALKRKSDILARYGGEEFVMLMPETGLEQAGLAANRFLQGVRELQITESGMTIPVTISIGGAAYTKDCQALDDLLEGADQALYQAKREGRDRVELLTYTSLFE